MRPSLRFLVLVTGVWGAARAITVGAFPAGALLPTPSRADTAPIVQAIVPTSFPPLEPLVEQPLPETWTQSGIPTVTDYAEAQPIVRYLRAAAPNLARQAGGGFTHIAGAAPSPVDPPIFLAPIAPIDDYPLSRIAAATLPPLPNTPAVVTYAAPVSLPPAEARLRFDRVQLTAWALLRGRPAPISTPSAIASGGTLGGSQAGARLTYNLDRKLALAMRMNSEIGKRGGEVAAGLRFQPIARVPVWISAERRQRVGKYGGGRNAFALFAEGGLWGQKLPLGFQFDGYAQAGVVGLRKRDKFVDGAMTVTRPLTGRFSGGLGFWGGAQPGVYRVDAGPRLTYRLNDAIAVHVDYRQRLAGNAEPGSGPAVTVAGNF